MKREVLKTTALTLAAVLLLTACESAASPSADDETGATNNVSESIVSTIPILDAEVEKRELPESAALDFVKKLKIGWSLGNTFDASGSGLDAETAWVGEKTTEQMILDIKAAGFNTIRLPVSWHYHVDEEFNIDADWLNRVNEVVDYAYKNGMYVILNIHHDNEKGYLYPDDAHLENSKKYVTQIWQQLAEKFKDYDEHLIFEAMNEPRWKGTDSEWWIQDGSDIAIEAINCINVLNQAVVDTIRATGGNNAERYIMVPSYCASVDYAVSDLFTLPTDSADGKILVSVHAYTPYNFALATGTNTVDKFVANANASCNQIDDLMQKIYDKYTSKGTGVVIGEFGALNRDNLEARVNFAAYYIAAARAVGVSCVWWDNDYFDAGKSGEPFGIYNRSEMKFEFPDIVVALMKYAE